jgi:hypothetical protein
VGRKNSKTSIGSDGHTGDTRPVQTRKTTKNLSTHDREERGCGEGVGLYDVYIRERGGGGTGRVQAQKRHLCYHRILLFIMNR